MRIPRILTVSFGVRSLFLAFLVFWFIIAYTHSAPLREFHNGDPQRDSAISYNLLAGNFLLDQSYLNERAFYPFLEPLFYAVLHLMTGIKVEVLMYNYPYIMAGMVFAIFILCVAKLFKSLFIALLSFFAFAFVMPYPSWVTHVYTSPLLLSFGMMILAIYLFHLAVSKEKFFYYLLAGAGIALTILSEPFVAMTLCAGITFYQLLIRRRWKYFFLMVLTSFILVSYYIVPLIVVYKLQTMNSGLVPYIQKEITLDYVFYGFTSIRWVSVFFILLGLIVSFLRRKKLDILLVCLYIFSAFFTVWGLLATQAKNWPNWTDLSNWGPPSLFVWQDIMKANQFISSILWAMGAWYVIELLSILSAKIFKRLTKQRGAFIFLTLLLTVYSFFALPVFEKKARYWLDIEKGYDIPFMDDWEVLAGWVKKNTSIDDVFVSDPSTSYRYIAGLTGRKVVVTYQSHANPFVNQEERTRDYYEMNGTTDVGRFLELSKKYKVKYAVVSPWEEWTTSAGIAKFLQDPPFEPVFRSGSVRVYKIKYNK